ncbi:molybdate ABC transporter substrate-binding protein [Peribacillus deserti]|uniref:Molybdate ABC transporter substrate-binding protein n=1 Tax=Peribacillus deserti TaxID=673318 RepID=A0A2N5MAA8_9BACI|nr:molybdate ABC transporter substrate-binding protein [Peribacillus deserti]PLT31267.1 molybdate ABC transporter substrate-binding protein [Peribacillus deserti]
MGKKIAMLFLFVSIMFAGSGCSSTETKSAPQTKEEILTISAASSLQKVLSELGPSYSAAHKKTKIRFNYGASGSLKHQITNGAPVDLFLSASSQEIEQLIDEGFMQRKDTEAFVGNSIVLVVPKSTKSVEDGFQGLTQTGVNRISIGITETVPAGKYAKETLQNLGMWNEVEGKLVYAKDVRQVLTYVETGNVDAGIVYKTDALSSAKVTLAAEAPDDTHSKIDYSFGIMKGTKNKQTALEFLAFLKSEEALKVFKKNGYTVRGFK